MGQELIQNQASKFIYENPRWKKFSIPTKWKFMHGHLHICENLVVVGNLSCITV